MKHDVLLWGKNKLQVSENKVTGKMFVSKMGEGSYKGKKQVAKRILYTGRLVLLG
jgi:hypothetical protein